MPFTTRSGPPISEVVYDAAFSLSRTVSKKFKEMSELYRLFAKDWEHCLDFSDEALLEMYHSETHGHPVSETNGFYHGKKWLSVNVTMWREDIKKGLLFKQELYQDGKYPAWWLDRVLKND